MVVAAATPPLVFLTTALGFEKLASLYIGE